MAGEYTAAIHHLAKVVTSRDAQVASQAELVLGTAMGRLGDSAAFSHLEQAFAGPNQRTRGIAAYAAGLFYEGMQNEVMARIWHQNAVLSADPEMARAAGLRILGLNHQAAVQPAYPWIKNPMLAQLDELTGLNTQTAGGPMRPAEQQSKRVVLDSGPPRTLPLRASNSAGEGDSGPTEQTSAGKGLPPSVTPEVLTAFGELLRRAVGRHPDDATLESGLARLWPKLTEDQRNYIGQSPRVLRQLQTGTPNTQDQWVSKHRGWLTKLEGQLRSSGQTRIRKPHGHRTVAGARPYAQPVDPDATPFQAALNGIRMQNSAMGLPQRGQADPWAILQRGLSQQYPNLKHPW